MDTQFDNENNVKNNFNFRMLVRGAGIDIYRNITYFWKITSEIF